MFNDRKHAAQELAMALEEYKDKNAVVLGIPRGGAVTAYYVATHLHAELSLLVSRKLGHPLNPEYAIGAIAEDGTLYLNPQAMGEVTQQQVDEAAAKQKSEIMRRVLLLRKNEPLPALKGRTVILVDDGIATGATLFAAIRMCRKHEAAKVVVSAPVSGMSTIGRLRKEADEVVILETPDYYQAVSQVYYSFPQVSDEEAVALFEKWKIEHLHAT